MIAQHKTKRFDKQQIVVLSIITLGIVALVVLYSTVPGFQFIELFVLIVAVIFAASGLKRRIVRGIMALIMLYFATGIAFSSYRRLGPYVAAARDIATFQMEAASGDTVSRGVLAFTFCGITAIIWIATEAIVRYFFEDTELPRLGVLDNVGGILVHLIIGILVATLLFNAMGYGNQRGAHNKALLRPAFNTVLRLCYWTQSIWFSRFPPPLYVYDLELSE